MYFIQFSSFFYQLIDCTVLSRSLFNTVEWPRNCIKRLYRCLFQLGSYASSSAIALSAPFKLEI